MANPAEARGSKDDRPRSLRQSRQSQDRTLADMLLDSREPPKAVPMELAALVADLVQVIRATQATAPKLEPDPALNIATLSGQELQFVVEYASPSERPGTVRATAARNSKCVHQQVPTCGVECADP
jgi:hypothetical protein